MYFIEKKVINLNTLVPNGECGKSATKMCNTLNPI